MMPINVLLGSQDPSWLAGITNTFKYKDFDLNIQLNGMFGRRMQDPTEMAYGLGGGDFGSIWLQCVEKD